MKAKQSSASVALSRLLYTIEAMRRTKVEQRVEEVLIITAVRCEHCQGMVEPAEAPSHPCWSK